MYITSAFQPASARRPSSKALAGWKAEVGAAFSSIGGLPVGVVVKRRFKVAEADGLAFLGCLVSGRGFRIIVKRTRVGRFRRPDFATEILNGLLRGLPEGRA